VNAADIKAALEFLKKNETGNATVRDLVRMELAGGEAGPLEIEGIEAGGWIKDMLDRLEGRAPFMELPQPEHLKGQLRPYQQRGFSWLAFLKQVGLGACLADDMGLGKTIQTLAMIQRDWDGGERRPVLLVCPTSVTGNWQKEASRFTPGLPVLLHHGISRHRGPAFQAEAARHALVISTYALLHRDHEALKEVNWAGIILDEAQNIKNAETKQARAARSLQSAYRVTLTGTPVENNVGDLWSIMEFLNPGFLGSQSAFRTRFFVPIQVYGDPGASERLRRITGPFILRRLKTDKSIIADLPDKLEMKVFCNLTKEQASLYEAVARDAQEAIESAVGIERKGIVLATLMKLKQVCNHPVQFLKDGSAIDGRSGKLARLAEMIEETLQVGDRSLIFTQFTEMGDILRRHLQESFGYEVLYLHGGVSKRHRDAMVERFSQSDGPRIFLLSLKAGGTGLNLTSANHVFHFDRWWNPAVENQATDRAFRIGQTRNVQVHKFVCAGTLEEKIDDMIERKKDIAGRVVGTGEGWLSELSNEELRSVFALREDAVAEPGARRAGKGAN
jgi:SNF2 family DNA or RNA helicase